MGTRIKTFDSTGVAPGGRLFAGDLNAVQDQYADLMNLAQTLGVGTIQVGEAPLQILRYGPGEARISGAVRTDGILRGLGGLYAGAFTTAQRDAIATGSRPFGLVILNTNTNRLEINLGTDPTPSWSGLSVSIARGTFGTIPGPSASNSGSLYFATDSNGGTLYYSDGTAWTKISPGLTEQMTPLDNSVSTVKIQANAVDNTKIASGAVRAAHIGSDVPVVPVGGILEWPWASGSIPAWSVLPYGQLLTQAAYPAMQVIADAAGRPYGGTAGVNFNTPDERGRVAVGKDDMGGTAANRITAAISGVSGATLGAVFGTEGITLTTAQLPAHNHGITGAPGRSGSATLVGAVGYSDPSHRHSWLDTPGGGSIMSFGTNAGTSHFYNDLMSGDPGIANAVTGIVVNNGSLAVSDTIGVNAGSLGTANAGSGTVIQNAQPSIIVNKLMRVV